MNAKEIQDLIGSDIEDLRERADRVRRDVCGDEVHLRGIIEFSNVCSRNCFYCGLRCDNNSLKRYTMRLPEILHIAAKAEKEGVRSIVLQSGENDDESSDRIAGIIAAIRERHDVAVVLSCGVRERSFYTVCREAGAGRYLLRHEAASPRLYRLMHPDSDREERLLALRTLKEIGYQTGTGAIVGIPHQTVRNLAQDIVLVRELDADMASFGPYVPHSGSLLGEGSHGVLDLALRVIAAARIALGSVHIPATTAFDAIAPGGREQALMAGANVVMANLTPPEYRELYLLYPRDGFTNDLNTTKELLRRAGRPIAQGYGDSLKAG